MGRTSLVLLLVLGACGFELDGGAPSGDTEISGDAGDPAGPDAAVEVVPCPTSYTGGYRAETQYLTWLAAEAACEADLPGHTHLVVLDTEAERAAIFALVQTLPGDAWVGIVRDPGDPWMWRYVTGGPATFAPFEGSEPNNMSGDQFTVVMRRSGGYLYDYGVNNTVQAICECDHRAPVNADHDPGT